MITNKDRSKWFGASDTATLMGSWETQTFKNFWLVKLGIITNDFQNIYTRAGNIFEHQIIDKICDLTGKNIIKGKYPVYKRLIRLRANFDGITAEKVIEIKTTNKGFDKVPKNYYMQCQVLMFATGKKFCELWAYKLNDEDYLMPYYATIDEDRLRKFEIAYDEDFINNEYLPKIKYLSKCLKKKRFPRKEVYECKYRNAG